MAVDRRLAALDDPSGISSARKTANENASPTGGWRFH
ncbi:hypothetical protein BH23GEM6_BH23GEM6_09890 [soil metagenome]